MSEKNEKSYYKPIKKEFENLFSFKRETYLEITANKKFSNKLKVEIRQSRNIIFRFLKQAAPDITGFIKKDSWAGFVEGFQLSGNI